MLLSKINKVPKGICASLRGNRFTTLYLVIALSLTFFKKVSKKEKQK